MDEILALARALPWLAATTTEESATTEQLAEKILETRRAFSVNALKRGWLSLPEDPFHPFHQTLIVLPHHGHHRYFVSGDPTGPRS